MSQSGPPILPPDLIPTAIVIKNIPFGLRKEELTARMQGLGLPVPYAFNYHFDKGVFRGLAFANFQNAQDTFRVIERLNGYVVEGRELRVEYKKMLPEAERERIEREKRERRGQLEEQHQPLPALQPAHSRSFAVMGHVSQAGADLSSGLDDTNADYVKYISELSAFKQDPTREIIVYPATLDMQERTVIHTIAQHLGLYHTSFGDGNDRQLRVQKHRPDNSSGLGHVNLMSMGQEHRSLNRAATFDFSQRRLHPFSSNQSIRERLAPEIDSRDLNLRGVRSVADLRDRRTTPSPAPRMVPTLNSRSSSHRGLFGEYTSAGGYTGLSSNMATPTTPGGTSGVDSALLQSLGNMNLADTHPGIIGSQRSGMNGSRTQLLDRQPAGSAQPIGLGLPERDFSWQRSQQNGHSQRNSGKLHAEAT
jgi:RNA recognition motif-containing protein